MKARQCEKCKRYENNKDSLRDWGAVRMFRGLDERETVYVDRELCEFCREAVYCELTKMVDMFTPSTHAPDVSQKTGNDDISGGGE